MQPRRKTVPVFSYSEDGISDSEEEFYEVDTDSDSNIEQEEIEDERELGTYYPPSGIRNRRVNSTIAHLTRSNTTRLSSQLLVTYRHDLPAPPWWTKKRLLVFFRGSWIREKMSSWENGNQSPSHGQTGKFLRHDQVDINSTAADAAANSNRQPISDGTNLSRRTVPRLPSPLLNQEGSSWSVHGATEGQSSSSPPINTPGYSVEDSIDTTIFRSGTPLCSNLSNAPIHELVFNTYPHNNKNPFKALEDRTKVFFTDIPISPGSRRLRGRGRGQPRGGRKRATLGRDSSSSHDIQPYESIIVSTSVPLKTSNYNPEHRMSNKVDTFSAQDPEMSTLSASQMSTPGFVSINAQDAELNGRLDRLNTNYQASPQTPTAVADKVIAAVGPLISQPVGPSASEDLVHSLKRSRDMTQGISAAQPTPQLAPVTAVQEPMATVPGPKAPMATTSTQNPTHDSETLDSGAPPLISSKVTDMPQTFDSSAIRASSLASSKELPLKVTCEEVPYEAFSDDSLHKRKFATDANISSSSANDLSQAQTQPITTITSVPVDAEEPTTFAPIAPMQYSKSREKGNHKEPSDSGSASKESDQPLPKGAAGVDTVNHQTARTPISTVPIQDRPSGQSTGETLESSHSGQIRAQTMFTAAPKSTSGITQDARGSLPTTPIQTHVPLSERYNKAVMTFGSTNPAFEKVSLPNVAANGTDRSTATITMSIDPGHILPSQRNINNIPGPNGSKTAMKRPMDSPQDSSPNLQAPGPNSQHPNWTFPIQPSNNGNPPTSGTTMPPRRGEPPTKKARTNSRDSSHSMGNTPQPLLAAQVHNPPPTATPSPTHHHKMPSTSTITPPSPPPTHQLITKEDGTSAISTTPSKSRYLARQQTAYISPRRIIKIFFYSRSGTIIPWEFHDFTLKSIFDILTSLFGKPASEKFAVKVSMMKGVFCDEHDCAEEKDCCKILRNWEKKTEGELVDWMDSAAMRCPYKRVDFLVSVWEEVGHSSLYYMARDGY